MKKVINIKDNKSEDEKLRKKQLERALEEAKQLEEIMKKLKKKK